MKMVWLLVSFVALSCAMAGAQGHSVPQRRLRCGVLYLYNRGMLEQPWGLRAADPSIDLLRSIYQPWAHWGRLPAFGDEGSTHPGTCRGK